MLIDELIEINLELASIAQLPLVHRKFAAFFKLTVEDEHIVITKDTLEVDLKKLDSKENTGGQKSSLIKMWFNNGGLELTVINTKHDIANIAKIEPKNLIFLGHPTADQLANFKKIKSDIIAHKNVFFSVTKDTKLEEYPRSRQVFFYLAGEPSSFFEYFAPYTKDKYYAKNNFKTSALQGVKLETLDYILHNNIGALVYFPEFKESKYLNIKDAAGFNYNLDVLHDDLQADIKANLLTALSSNNLYNQSNILRLESVMAGAIDVYVDLNLIRSYKTASKPLGMQTGVDIKNNILRGLQATYQVETEIEQVKVAIKEEV